jgi:hypothetical protein
MRKRARVGTGTPGSGDADEDEPQSHYSIERDLVDTVEGECPSRSALGSFHGDFAQDGDRLVFTGWWIGSGGSGPIRWEGTIDETNAFSLQLTAHPFTGEFDYQIWTADGSFNANRNSVTGTERFRGTPSPVGRCATASSAGWEGGTDASR